MKAKQAQGHGQGQPPCVAKLSLPAPSTRLPHEEGHRHSAAPLIKVPHTCASPTS